MGSCRAQSVYLTTRLLGRLSPLTSIVHILSPETDNWSSAPSYAQVKFWVGEFKCGRISLEDEARSGRPLDATNEEMCKKVWDLVYSDRRIQVEEIAQALGISHGSVSTILHDRLGMRKLTARWVPKSISDEQMATRASVCSALLKHFRSKDDFRLRLVTVDETGFVIMNQRIQLRVVSG